MWLRAVQIQRCELENLVAQDIYAYRRAEEPSALSQRENTRRDASPKSLSASYHTASASAAGPRYVLILYWKLSSVLRISSTRRVSYQNEDAELRFDLAVTSVIA